MKSVNCNQIQSDNKAVTKYVLFLISPVLGLLYALGTPNTKSSYSIFRLFIIFFGFSLFFDGSVRYDGLLIAYDFQGWAKLGFNDYIERISSVFSVQSFFADKDYFEVTLEFLVSRITSNYHIFFMFVALFYAFFMPRVMRFFTSLKRAKFNYSYYVLFYIFVMAVPLTAIAGVRFGLATWVFLYSFFCITIERKKWYLLLMLCTPLVHITYLFAIVVYLVYYLSRGRYRFWLVLLILSFVFSELSLTLLKDRIDSFTGVTWWGHWIDSYANFEEYNDTGEAGTGFFWVVPIFEVLTRVYFFVFLLIVYKNRQLFNSCKSSKKIFDFTLACYTISNFCMSIPHLGGRFIGLCYPMLAYLWVKYSLDKHYRFMLLMYPFFFLLYLKQSADVFINSLDYTFLLSPFVNIVSYLFFNTPITPADVSPYLL